MEELKPGSLRVVEKPKLLLAICDADSLSKREMHQLGLNLYNREPRIELIFIFVYGGCEPSISFYNAENLPEADVEMVRQLMIKQMEKHDIPG